MRKWLLRLLIFGALLEELSRISLPVLVIVLMIAIGVVVGCDLLLNSGANSA